MKAALLAPLPIVEWTFLPPANERSNRLNRCYLSAMSRDRHNTPPFIRWRNYYACALAAAAQWHLPVGACGKDPPAAGGKGRLGRTDAAEKVGGLECAVGGSGWGWGSGAPGGSLEAGRRGLKRSVVIMAHVVHPRTAYVTSGQTDPGTCRAVFRHVRRMIVGRTGSWQVALEWNTSTHTAEFWSRRWRDYKSNNRYKRR